jgi:DNA-directed RNA polymerase specialized sigma54-like protein
MSLDQNEKKLIEKLSIALNLLNASEEDLQTISAAEKIDNKFLEKADNIFDNTEACTVCRHAFHSWRKTLDDETVLSFIDDWINWKTHNNPNSKVSPSK